MHLDPTMAVAAAVVGVLVGMTGAGGGALMTPMLVLVFGVTPSTAVSSDLVASVLMRPAGAAVHLRRGTVDLAMVGWLAAGSVPVAFVGSIVLRQLGTSPAAEAAVRDALGAALLAGAGAMALRGALDRRAGREPCESRASVALRPLPTVVVGAIGGAVVGVTSVGSGSLVVVLLVFLYPALGAGRLVGTDLVQAVPLTLSAALGAMVFGHVDLGVSASVAVGGVPGAVLGGSLSSSVPDRYLRPAITVVILASGLRYVGLGAAAVAWALAALVAAGGSGRAVGAWRRREEPEPARRSSPAHRAPLDRR